MATVAVRGLKRVVKEYRVVVVVIDPLMMATDSAFKDGKVGDYLFLGNMVYTVSC